MINEKDPQTQHPKEILIKKEREQYYYQRVKS
jgi:hypothetical protein